MVLIIFVTALLREKPLLSSSRRREAHIVAAMEAFMPDPGRHSGLLL
jgi:hypothetical protein